jgi:hypothetical protein
MTKFVTPKYRPAERIYPAMPMQFARVRPAAGPGRDPNMLHSHTGNGTIFPRRSTL